MIYSVVLCWEGGTNLTWCLWTPPSIVAGEVFKVVLEIFPSLPCSNKVNPVTNVYAAS